MRIDHRLFCHGKVCSILLRHQLRIEKQSTARDNRFVLLNNDSKFIVDFLWNITYFRKITQNHDLSAYKQLYSSDCV